MSVKDLRGKIYLEKTFQFNFSREIGRVLNSKGWRNAEEIFVLYDPKTDEVTITRDTAKFLQYVMSDKEAELYTQLIEKKGLPGVSTPKKPHPQYGQDGICPRFKIPLLHDGGPDEPHEPPRRWS